MLGKLGIDPNFGVAQLTALSQDLQGLSSGQRQRRATNFSPEDLQELGQGMQRFQQMAMMACQRASMTPEEAVAWEKRAQEEQRKQQQAMIAQRQRMKHVQTAVSVRKRGMGSIYCMHLINRLQSNLRIALSFVRHR